MDYPGAMKYPDTLEEVAAIQEMFKNTIRSYPSDRGVVLHDPPLVMIETLSVPGTDNEEIVAGAWVRCLVFIPAKDVTS